MLPHYFAITISPDCTGPSRAEFDVLEKIIKTEIFSNGDSSRYSFTITCRGTV
jgi:hypothetical protein